VILPTRELVRLVTRAVQAAQQSGDLPTFEIPDIEIRPPKRPDQGDLGTGIAMQLKKFTGSERPPNEIAEIIVRHMPSADFVSGVEVINGYINFRLNEDWLRTCVNEIIARGDQLYALDIGAGKRAQVEFVSANPTGPLTVGRSRGGVLGDAIARILEAAGYAVEREYYFNNAGAQMEHLGNSLRIRYVEALGLPVEIPGEKDKTFYQGEYLRDIAKQLVAEQGEALKEADWKPFKEYAEQKMFAMIRASLDRINIHHDVFFNENSLYDSGAVWETLEELKKRGCIYSGPYREGADEGERLKARDLPPAQWFRSTQFGDHEDRVLVKSDGSPTYTLPDIAYHVNKLERDFDLLVNILGADHLIEHQVVKYAIRALGMDVSRIRVIIMQFVTIKGGRMSTRKGEYVMLDEVVDQTGSDVVRYMLLARSPNSGLDFDLDLALKQSNENPVFYIQNAHVRCAGIAREAEARGISDEGADLSLLGQPELTFLRKALELGEVIEQAALNLEPHKLAFYAQDLASIFHPIYDSVRALHGEVPPEVAKARLRFYRAAQVVFKRVLTLMGMSAPERM
jgi:arginyl-tRNA synthetase